MLNKLNRISNNRLIEKLNRQGQAYKTKYYVFKYLPSNLPDSKFAVSISKKVSNKAVDRNRLRRQTQESLQAHLQEFTSPIVCLVIQKNGTPQSLDFQTIDEQVKEFVNAQKANV